MATAKATAAAESKKKKPAVVKSKSKIKEEISVSSDESDFDDEEDPDCVEVPGGGRDLQTISKIGTNEPGLASPSQSAAGDDSLILPSPSVSVLRAPVPKQPGYEIIRIPPGTSPFGLGASTFGLGAGIKQQTVNAMHHKIGIIRGTLPSSGGALRVNVPLSAVQSMLNTNVFQVSVHNFIQTKHASLVYMRALV